MYRKMVVSLGLVLCSAAAVMAEDDNAAGAPGIADPGAKMVAGMSILGNDEAPKSLFIVPWKSSEMGVETSLERMLDERDEPVDREVFMRQLDFFEVSSRK